jgi:hypothetical protein
MNEGEEGGTNVTMTAPLALTHAKTTWVGVMPRRAAAALTGASTGPFGYVVTGLSEEKGEGEGMRDGEGMGKRGRTYARLPYASVTIPCRA